MKYENHFERLKAKMVVSPSTGCWLWTGVVKKNRKYPSHNYGLTWLPAPGTKRGQRSVGAHRAMWIVLHGEPGEDLDVCHKCDTPLCINPDHLFLGTHQQNLADSRNNGRHFHGSQKACKWGHPFEGDNVYVTNSGRRQCKTCCRDRQRKRWHEDALFRARQMELRRLRRAIRTGSPSPAEAKP